MRAYVIIDLGFGDAGKGLITDFLVRQTQAGVVVRYNGGAQAGHNVVTPDGIHHTFSQFGSGSFSAGVKTYLSKDMVVHPSALLVEGDILVNKGVNDIFSRIKINPQALLITPYHQAANRIKELARGSGRHGSCGVGVGETVEDSLAGYDDCIVAGDLAKPDLIQQKMAAIRERKKRELGKTIGPDLFSGLTALEWQVFLKDDLADLWMDSIQRITELDLVDDSDVLSSWVKDSETLIFEGAQGVLLDTRVGFYPYNSWTNCRPENAIALVNDYAPTSEIIKVGVSRCYAVRHGPGPLPTETHELDGLVTDHNQLNSWQGNVRYGWFDQVLFNYALNVIKGVDLLAITHLDILNRLKSWKMGSHYHAALETSLISFPSLSSGQKEKLTQQLLAVKTQFDSYPSVEEVVLDIIKQTAGLPVSLASHGPKAQDVQFLIGK